MPTAKEILRLIADTFAPRLCTVCRRPSAGAPLCTGCLMELSRTDIHLRQTSPMTAHISNGIAPPTFTAAWFHYDPQQPQAELIRQAKYGDRPGLARDLGRLFASELTADEPRCRMAGLPAISDIDLLLPVPIYRDRLRRRGYNQARQIALGIEDETGIPVGDNLLATGAHSTQTLLSIDRRRRNLSGQFRLIYPDELDGLNVAIVDDIMTSGATATECTAAISLSGATPASISMIVLGLAAGAG